MEVPVLLSGCEKWTLIKEHKRRNDRAETKFVLSVAGYTLYEEVREWNTYNSNEITVDCRHKQTQRVSRLKHAHIPQVTEWTHSDRRNVGQPRKRWNRPKAIKMEQAWSSLYTLLLLIMINITLLQYHYIPPEFSNQTSAWSPY